MVLDRSLAQLAAGTTLSEADAHAIVMSMLRGEPSEVEVAAFLTALRVRGETAEELAGGARALRATALDPGTAIPGLLDTCGTGGDHAGTFNISTAAAIVVSACGVPVAKHGNRAVSSRTGSADVLEELGVRIDGSPTATRATLTELGIAFFFAPLWHPAVRHVMPVRRALGFRTLFNLLGPLANPMNADFQLLGCPTPALAHTLGEAIARLGTKGATLVAGSDGLDEVTLGGVTHVVVVRDGDLVTSTWHPSDFGLPEVQLEVLQVQSARESADRIRSVLAGELGPARDIVLANAAAGLWTTGRVTDLADGVRLAARAIDEGAAEAKLRAWTSFSQANGAEDEP